MRESCCKKPNWETNLLRPVGASLGTERTKLVNHNSRHDGTQQAAQREDKEQNSKSVLDLVTKTGTWRWNIFKSYSVKREFTLDKPKVTVETQNWAVLVTLMPFEGFILLNEARLTWKMSLC